MLEKVITNRGERHAFAATDKQSGTEYLFQFLNRLGQSRLRKACSAAGGANTAVARHINKRAQLV